MIAFSPQPLIGAFKTGDLIKVGDRFAVVWPAGSDTVLSVQRDGRYETRPRSAIGAWETCRRVGDKLLFEVEGNVFVIPIVDNV